MPKNGMLARGPLVRVPFRRKKSKRQIAYDEEFRSMRPLVLHRDGYVCQANLRSCTIRATVVHHRKLRSQGGKNTLANLVSLCVNCHTEIHTKVAWALEGGWLVH